jgi:hypothetical protein
MKHLIVEVCGSEVVYLKTPGDKLEFKFLLADKNAIKKSEIALKEYEVKF